MEKELSRILKDKYDGIKCVITKKKKHHHRKCERECVSQQNNGCCGTCSPCCQGLGCSNCCNKTQTCECRKCRKCPTTGQTNCCSPCCKPCSPCCQGGGCSNCCNKTQVCEKKKKHCKKSKKHCHRKRRCECQPQTQQGCSPCSPCSPCCQQGMAPALMGPLFAPAPAPFMANTAPFVNAAQVSGTAENAAPLSSQQSAPLQEGNYGSETITRTASGQERITCNPARTLSAQPCSSLSEIVSPCCVSLCQKGIQGLSLAQQNLLGNPLRNIASFFPCLQQYPCIQQLLARTANTPFSLPLFQGCLDELNKIIETRQAAPKQPSKIDKIIHEVSLGNVVMQELFDYLKNAIPIKSTDPKSADPKPTDKTKRESTDSESIDSGLLDQKDINFDKIIAKLDVLEKKLNNIYPSLSDSFSKLQSTTEQKLKSIEQSQEKEYLENQDRSDQLNKTLDEINNRVRENTESLEENKADIKQTGTVLSNFDNQLEALNEEVTELKNRIDKTKEEIENLKKEDEARGGN